MQKFPLISFIISTYNRCDVLLKTLAQIQRCGLDRDEFDIHVVDNASSDGTSQRVRQAFDRVKLITLSKNKGSVAKNEALPHALGRFVVFLDDDSYPIPGAVQRMIRHFDADPKLGAATFTVNLPDGSNECSAYPDVFIGCGVGFRRRALRATGGLPDDFFMQAEEYDLSLRLLDAGYRVRTFDDLHVIHLKTPQSRISARTMRLDVRNNLLLILRRFPMRHIPTVGWDWIKRYAWIAQSKKQTGAFAYGIIHGLLHSLIHPQREPVSDEAFEQFAKLDEITHRLRSVFSCSEKTEIGQRDTEKQSSVECISSVPLGLCGDSSEQCKPRVLFVDCGKGIHGYWRACRDLGIEVVAIADRNLHHPARRYRGVRIVDDKTGRSLRYDAVVISNLSPVHARKRRDQWRLAQDRPVYDLFDTAFEASTSDARPAASESHRTAARTA